MTFRIFTGSILVLFLWCATLPAMAQQPGIQQPAQERVQERAKRWHAMKSEKQQAMRKRLQRLHGMRADKRQSKLDRAKRLREIMADVYGDMDPAGRARMDALDPSERAQLLGHLALEEARSRSRQARLVLGPNDQQRTDETQPSHNMHVERKRLHEEFLSKARQKLEAYVKKNGLPEGFSLEKWQHFRLLKGPVFGRELRKLSRKYPQWIKVMGRPPGRRTVDRERWELHKAMRLPSREHMDLVRSHDKDARTKAMKSRRKRVMKVLIEHKSLTPERLKEVGNLSNKEFMGWMRTRLRPPVDRRDGPRFAPGRGPGLSPHPTRRPPHEGRNRPTRRPPPHRVPRDVR